VCVEQIGRFDQECLLLGLEVGEWFFGGPVCSLSGSESSLRGKPVTPTKTVVFTRYSRGEPKTRVRRRKLAGNHVKGDAWIEAASGSRSP
jgi:hypothetical protein